MVKKKLAHSLQKQAFSDVCKVWALKEAHAVHLPIGGFPPFLKGGVGGFLNAFNKAYNPTQEHH